VAAYRVTQPPQRRRRHLRRIFDQRVRSEWNRYSGEPRRVLHRALRERFLRLHLTGVKGTILELGPGPGRFTPVLRRQPRVRVVAVDLSRACLRSAQRRVRHRANLPPVEWIQGAGEHLPLAARSVDVAVVLGNIVCFAAFEGPALLKEIARVVGPRGRLIIDFSSPVGATQEFVRWGLQHRLLPRILRRPGHYFVSQVLRDGFQPYAPARLGRYEFRFYTAQEATEELDRAGFRVIDTMSVAPITAHENRIVLSSQRQPRTWEALLSLEERAGRRPGVYETGDGFVMAASRK
jgi:ubiquinone/menaquinone biosynthesis C-methylase UbiE